MIRLAVLASGKGTNLQAILNACRQKRIPATVSLVLSDQPKAYALTRARREGIETLILKPRDFSSRARYDAALLRHLKARRIRYVVLAGFMRILSPRLVRAYRHRILNIHPALLPAFKGVNAVRDVLKAGAQVTGVTVHLVDEGVDTGPIVLQEEVPVRARDTESRLHERIHRVEHRLYPKAVRLLAEGRLQVLSGKVKVLGR